MSHCLIMFKLGRTHRATRSADDPSRMLRPVRLNDWILAESGMTPFEMETSGKLPLAGPASDGSAAPPGSVTGRPDVPKADVAAQYGFRARARLAQPPEPTRASSSLASLPTACPPSNA